MKNNCVFIDPMNQFALRSSSEMAAMSIEVPITIEMIEDFKESAEKVFGYDHIS